MTHPLLCETSIRESLDPIISQQLPSIHVFDEVDSTNDVLWSQVKLGLTDVAVCLANSQTNGRGRRGSQWVSPASGNLYLSLRWPLEAEQARQGLTIAIGIGLIQALESLGYHGLKLKWPNDVLFNRQKLAGILVESRVGKTSFVVVGIGLNYALPAELQQIITQPITSLEALNPELPCRNRLAATIIQKMIETLQVFSQRGLQDFLSVWPRYDALYQQPVQISSEQETFIAQAYGINESGELNIMYQQQLQTLSSSHVSIRLLS